MKTGIIVALEGKTIKDPVLAYASTNKHLLINPKKQPKHMDIIEIRGGTAYSFNSNTGGSSEEVLLSIPHGLSYIPRTSAFMYARDVPPSFSFLQGLYGSFVLLSPGPPFYDVIFYGADEKNFYIKHRSTCKVDGLGNTFTSEAPKFLLRVKYMINSNKAVQEPYEMTYTPF